MDGDRKEDKERFARLWLRHGDPFKAALELFPGDTGKALRIQFEWPNDPEILDLRTRLLAEEGAQSFLPDRFELARRVFEEAVESTTRKYDKLQGFKLYAEIMGFMTKPSEAADGNAADIDPDPTFIFAPIPDN